MIRRIRIDGYTRGEHLTSQEPFVLDVRAHDIPKTIERMIRALPDNCVAISLRLDGGFTMRRWAERAARQRGVRILWLGPKPLYGTDTAQDVGDLAQAIAELGARMSELEEDLDDQAEVQDSLGSRIEDAEWRNWPPAVVMVSLIVCIALVMIVRP